MADEYGSDFHGRQARDVEVAAHSLHRIPLIIGSVSLVVVIVAGLGLVSILAGTRSDTRPVEESASVTPPTTTPELVTTTTLVITTDPEPATTTSIAEPPQGGSPSGAATSSITQGGESTVRTDPDPVPDEPAAEVGPVGGADGAVPGSVPPVGSPLAAFPPHWIVGPDGHTYGRLLEGGGLDADHLPDFSIWAQDEVILGYIKESDILGEREEHRGLPYYESDGVTLLGYVPKD